MNVFYREGDTMPCEEGQEEEGARQKKDFNFHLGMINAMFDRNDGRGTLDHDDISEEDLID